MGPSVVPIHCLWFEIDFNANIKSTQEKFREEKITHTTQESQIKTKKYRKKRKKKTLKLNLLAPDEIREIFLFLPGPVNRKSNVLTREEVINCHNFPLVCRDVFNATTNSLLTKTLLEYFKEEFIKKDPVFYPAIHIFLKLNDFQIPFSMGTKKIKFRKEYLQIKYLLQARKLLVLLAKNSKRSNEKRIKLLDNIIEIVRNKYEPTFYKKYVSEVRSSFCFHWTPDQPTHPTAESTYYVNPSIAIDCGHFSIAQQMMEALKNTPMRERNFSYNNSDTYRKILVEINRVLAMVIEVDQQVNAVGRAGQLNAPANKDLIKALIREGLDCYQRLKNPDSYDSYGTLPIKENFEKKLTQAITGLLRENNLIDFFESFKQKQNCYRLLITMLINQNAISDIKKINTKTSGEFLHYLQTQANLVAPGREILTQEQSLLINLYFDTFNDRRQRVNSLDPISTRAASRAIRIVMEEYDDASLAYLFIYHLSHAFTSNNKILDKPKFSDVANTIHFFIKHHHQKLLKAIVKTPVFKMYLQKFSHYSIHRSLMDRKGFHGMINCAINCKNSQAFALLCTFVQQKNILEEKSVRAEYDRVFEKVIELVEAGINENAQTFYITIMKHMVQTSERDRKQSQRLLQAIDMIDLCQQQQRQQQQHNLNRGERQQPQQQLVHPQIPLQQIYHTPLDQQVYNQQYRALIINYFETYQTNISTKTFILYHDMMNNPLFLQGQSRFKPLPKDLLSAYSLFLFKIKTVTTHQVQARLEQKKREIEQLIKHMFQTKQWKPGNIDIVLAVKSGHKATVTRIIDALFKYEDTDKPKQKPNKIRRAPNFIHLVCQAVIIACKEGRSEILHELFQHFWFQLLLASENHLLFQQIKNLTATAKNKKLFYQVFHKKLIDMMKKSFSRGRTNRKKFLQLFQCAVDFQDRKAIDEFFKIIKQGNQSNNSIKIAQLLLPILKKCVAEPDQAKQSLYQLLLKYLIELKFTRQQVTTLKKILTYANH